MGELGKREIRIAVVMTGGVSLAVWMGGAAYELYRLTRAGAEEAESFDLYARLKELTRSDVAIDVVSGTSAGGLNGVILAAVVAFDRPSSDLLTLRDTWLNTGALRDLLRSPNETDPQSLLKGDEFFLPRIEEILKDLMPSGVSGVDTPCRDVDLRMTTTLLEPNVDEHEDEFGEKMTQSNHRGEIRFRFRPDRPAVDPARLARAARSSASFPGAFEASLIRSDFPLAGVAELNFAPNRFVMDGGVLNNQPLRLAMNGVAERRADREVRRIIAFVVPDPKQLSPPDTNTPAVPSLGKVLASTFAIPMQQSIHDDLEALENFNRRIDEQILGRRLIELWQQESEDVEALASQNHELYLRVHGALAGGYALRLLPERLSPSVRDPVVAQFAARRREILSEALAAQQADPGGLLRPDGDVQWGFGIYACRYLVETALGVVRRLLRADRVLSPGTTLLGDARIDLEVEFATLHAQRGKIAELRERDREYWREWFTSFTDQTEDLAAQIDDGYGRWAAQGIGTGLSAAARETIFALVRVRNRMDIEPLRVRDVDAYRELVALTPSGGDATRCLMRMVSLFILQTITAPGNHDPGEERPISLVQLSGRAPALDLHHPDPASKLSGIQLGHFGAFLKRSWRANDWMWGRSDAADRIVRVLLEPDRLRRLFVTSEDCLQALRRLHREASMAITDSAQELPTTCEEEIRSAWASSKPLADTWRAFAELAQIDALRDELPIVAREARLAGLEGGDTRQSRAFVDAVGATEGRLEPQRVLPALRALRIAQEGWIEELRSDLGVDVASKAAAAASNALRGPGGSTRAKLLNPIDRIVRLVYHLAQASVSGAGAMNALLLMVLASAVAVLALDVAVEDLTLPTGVRVAAASAFATLYLAVPRRRYGVRDMGLIIAVAAAGLALAPLSSVPEWAAWALAVGGGLAGAPLLAIHRHMAWESSGLLARRTAARRQLEAVRDGQSPSQIATSIGRYRFLRMYWDEPRLIRELEKIDKGERRWRRWHLPVNVMLIASLVSLALGLVFMFELQATLQAARGAVVTGAVALVAGSWAIDRLGGHAGHGKRSFVRRVP